MFHCSIPTSIDSSLAVPEYHHSPRAQSWLPCPGENPESDCKYGVNSGLQATKQREQRVLGQNGGHRLTTFSQGVCDDNRCVLGEGPLIRADKGGQRWKAECAERSRYASEPRRLVDGG